MAVVLGCCPRSFKDQKTGEPVSGYAFRVGIDWNSIDGVGYDVINMFLRSDSPDFMETVVKYKGFYNSGSNVKVSYNRYGKITSLEEC